MKLLLFVLCIQILCLECNGSPFDKVIDSACRTNPSWVICQTTPTKAKLRDDVISKIGESGNPESFSTDETVLSQNVSDTPDTTLKSTTEMDNSSISDSIDSEASLSDKKETTDEIFEAVNFPNNQSLFDGESRPPSSTSTSGTGGVNVEALKQHYCQAHIGNFTSYCTGSERFKVPETLQPRLTAFCDSFKATCYPMHSTPCTPDCDQRFHPHCTVSCKCNYLYPFVIKFCSPVTIHSLEDVCRSWFIKCAKIHAIGD